MMMVKIRMTKMTLKANEDHLVVSILVLNMLRHKSHRVDRLLKMRLLFLYGVPKATVVPESSTIELFFRKGKPVTVKLKRELRLELQGLLLITRGAQSESSP